MSNSRLADCVRVFPFPSPLDWPYIAFFGLEQGQSERVNALWREVDGTSVWAESGKVRLGLEMRHQTQVVRGLVGRVVSIPLEV